MENKELSLGQIETEFSLLVNYFRALQEMINYGWTKIKNYTVSPEEMTGRREEVFVKLFHFNKHILSEYVISEMDKAGYRPATLIELFALGEVRPDLQRQFPIIALGTFWPSPNGSRDVPCLDVGGRDRRLDLPWSVNARGWHAVYRFLAVRK